MDTVKMSTHSSDAHEVATQLLAANIDGDVGRALNAGDKRPIVLLRLAAAIGLILEELSPDRDLNLAARDLLTPYVRDIKNALAAGSSDQDDTTDDQVGDTSDTEKCCDGDSSSVGTFTAHKRYPDGTIVMLDNKVGPLQVVAYQPPNISQCIDGYYTLLTEDDRLIRVSPNQIVDAALRPVPLMTAAPVGLNNLVNQVTYKRGWTFELNHDTHGSVVLWIVSCTADAYDHDHDIRVRHEFLVPAATYNRDTWAAWLFDRVRDVETHEAGEFFKIDGYREFAPHHGNGEDPYRVWHVSDHAATRKRAGED